MISETLIIFLTSVMSLNGITEKDNKALEVKETSSDKKRTEQIQPLNETLRAGGWDLN